jgi:hypothetical protein
MGGRSGAGSSTRAYKKMSSGERNKYYAGLSTALRKGASIRQARSEAKVAVGKYRAQKNRKRKSS